MPIEDFSHLVETWPALRHQRGEALARAWSHGNQAVKRIEPAIEMLTVGQLARLTIDRHHRDATLWLAKALGALGSNASPVIIEARRRRGEVQRHASTERDEAVLLLRHARAAILASMDLAFPSTGQNQEHARTQGTELLKQALVGLVVARDWVFRIP